MIGNELGKKGPGQFVVPGLLKFKVARKPATKAKTGINPFTKEPMTYKAKPARNVVKALPLSRSRKWSKRPASSSIEEKRTRPSRQPNPARAGRPELLGRRRQFFLWEMIDCTSIRVVDTSPASAHTTISIPFDVPPDALVEPRRWRIAELLCACARWTRTSGVRRRVARASLG